MNEDRYNPTPADVACFTAYAQAETRSLSRFRHLIMRRSIARRAANYGMLAMGIRSGGMDLTNAAQAGGQS